MTDPQPTALPAKRQLTAHPAPQLSLPTKRQLALLASPRLTLRQLVQVPSRLVSVDVVLADRARADAVSEQR
jgi:hypothetical protein